MENDEQIEGSMYDNAGQVRPEYDGTLNDPTFVAGDDARPDLPFDEMHLIMAAQAQLDPSQTNRLPVDNQATGVEDNDGTAPQKMTDDELIGIIKQKIESSHQWYGTGKLSSDRIDADRYYRGEPLGNEIEGRSQVVSRDVAEAVDAAMPSLMRIFAGGDQVVNFEANDEQDEEAAKQATDYINHVFMQDNEGFAILYTWFKDALLKKNGIVKCWHDVRMKRTKESYQGLTQEQYAALSANPNIQVTNIEQYQDSVPVQDPQTGAWVAQPVTLFNCVVVSAKPEKRVCVEPVAPDEFIIERRAVSLDKTGFCAHRGKRTISDLLECGYDREKVMAIPRGDGRDYSGEREERFNNEDPLALFGDEESDESMRKVWIVEAYIKCDYDGDGIAEWRCVTLAGDATGNSASILANEETDDHAFADLTPKPEPHKFYGLSFFDDTKDVQDIKTALLRGILDSTYLSNNPRLGAVDGQVNMDDLLDSRPGGVVRMKNANALVPIETTPISAAAMSVVQYVDEVKDKRTGVSTMSAGLNPNILNSSATGADIINNNNQQRLELIARIFAETGVKRLFRRIFQLVCQYQDVPRTVRLRGKWVQVDPRDWKDKMDVVATVGIGLGTKQQQAATAMQMLTLDQQIIQMQGGLKGPFVKPEHVYAKLAKLVEAVGWKTPDPYYQDPKTAPPEPPEQPTPAQQLEMQKLQSESQKAQSQAITAQSDVRTKGIDLEMKKLDYAIKLVELEALKLQSGQQIAQRADNETAYSDIPANNGESNEQPRNEA